MEGNTQNNIKVQEGMRQLLAMYQWDFFVTANFNRAIEWYGARRLLREWHARIDRKMLGGRWQRKADQRTFFIACCEGGETNLHWHMLVRVKEERRQQFQHFASGLWEDLVPSGSMDIQLLPGQRDAERAAGYAAKGLWRDEGISRFVLSTEFVTDRNPQLEGSVCYAA